MLMHGIQFKLFGTGLVTSAGVEAGAFVNPLDPDAEPTIQAFCVPFVYLDRDLLKLIKPTHGVTVTTVVTKPKSRGFVKLASPIPPTCRSCRRICSSTPTTWPTMMAGQRFFLRAFQNAPLGNRIDRILRPDPDDLGDEALAGHCRKMVKTNYHPAGTARMGADGDRMAVLDAAMCVRGVDNLRVADMSACPDINSGNTAAPAMMLGDRCASFILQGRHQQPAIGKPEAHAATSHDTRYRLAPATTGDQALPVIHVPDQDFTTPGRIK